MIEIIPFNKNVFEEFNLEKTNLTKYCYINDIYLTSKLLAIELPIENRKIALRNIFDFLSYINNKMNEKNSTLLSIPSSKLIEFFNRDCYKEYMTILSNLNIITDVPYTDGTFYKKGELNKQYRVHNEYINKEELAIIILEEDRSKKEFNNEVEGLDKRYINTINNLEINIKDAIKDEILYYKENNLDISTLRSRIDRLFYTKRKRFIKKGVKVDRIYHSFSNISKVSRKHLSIKMMGIDIVNCQPLLLVAYLKRNNMLLDSNYQKDCEDGLFYEKFVGINNLDRDKSKVQIYKNIFFAFNERSLFNKEFKKIYPNTWSSLSLINKGDISLASRLQNIESELFNNLVPKKSKHYFTLFDAIYIDNMNDANTLIKTINNFFNNLGIEVKIKIG